ncbi:MAG: flagellar hook-length control protein FliK [Planctomycetes bacterium]|nr:flagellar hook-length control protein FliK [Planctomycetota bacterium]
MSEVVSIQVTNQPNIPAEIQLNGVVQEKIDTQHYVIKINDQLIDVISTGKEFEVGDQLILKLVNISPQRVELNLISVALSATENETIQMLKSFGIEPTEANITLLKSLIQYGIVPSKEEFANILKVVQSNPEQSELIRDITLFLAKNNIFPSSKLIEYITKAFSPSDQTLRLIIEDGQNPINAENITQLIKLQLNPTQSLETFIKRITASTGQEIDLKNSEILGKLISDEITRSSPQDIVRKIEGFLDKTQRTKIINTLQNISNENKLYFELPVYLLDQNATLKFYYEKEKGKKQHAKQQDTIYIGINLENSGDILARFSQTSKRYSLDFYTENEKTYSLIKKNTNLLENALTNQGFSGTINTHLDKKVKLPPFFKKRVQNVDLVA